MGDELEELRHNLKVSFSRMKSDIKANQDKIDQVLEINQQLQAQIKNLEAKLSQTSTLKSELMRSFKRNKKQIIKQRMIALIQDRQIPVPELKEIIVDEKKYCSKATFYRYIDEMKKEGLLNVITVDNNQIVLLLK
jgi:chromosome segregation ATPase